jgi:hypothetical protein
VKEKVRERERVTCVDNVTVSSDVVEGLRTVLFDPERSLATVGRVTGGNDGFSLIGDVNFHRMGLFRHRYYALAY